MQTFLPYDDFMSSASCLDMKRLGKQRVEVKQILQALLAEPHEKIGWRNHPATKMWRGYELALCTYGKFICREWLYRGYKDTCLEYIEQVFRDLKRPKDPSQDAVVFEWPPWLGWEDFHRSHKSNLLRKDPEFYGRYDWNVPADLPYIWPDGNI